MFIFAKQNFTNVLVKKVYWAHLYVRTRISNIFTLEGVWALQIEKISSKAHIKDTW
jgi:hypothetical protein